MRVAALALLMVTACGSSAPPPAMKIHTRGLAPWAGKWKVQRYAFAKVSALTEAEASAKVGLVAEIGEGRATLAGEECLPHTVDSGSTFAADYMSQQFRITPESVGITDANIMVVRTGCSGLFGEFFETHPGEIVLSWDGTLYFMQKVIQ